MSNATKLRTDFRLAVDHIRDRVVLNVSEARNQKQFTINDRDVEKLVRVIESAFEQGFINASSQIEKSINESLR